MTKYEIVDTIVSIPWQGTECGDDTGWRLGTYWFSGEDDYPYTYDEVSDGDHEPEDELPSDKDVAESWKRYHEWCLEEGRDPLGEYTRVEQTQRLLRTYHVSFLATIVGFRVHESRASNESWSEGLSGLPESVASLVDREIPKTDEDLYRIYTDLFSGDEVGEIEQGGSQGLKLGVRGSRSESGARYRLKLSGYILVPRDELVIRNEVRRAAAKALGRKPPDDETDEADVDQFDPVRDGWVGRDGRP
jgi:hypothetical protein